MVSPSFHAAFSGERRNVPLARNAIVRFARICGFSQDEVADIRVAAGEALSNAVEHGSAHRSSGFSVDCTLEDDELRIEIRDNGEGFKAEALHVTGPIEERERGFGILLMLRLMHGVQYSRNGTCVRLYRRRTLET
jgi:anti-sigma regulatory factor (Ser/Thr protein kinase)